MSLASRVLTGLLAGGLVGYLLTQTGAAPGPAVDAAVVVGGVFVDLIRMTAMPLVVSLVIGSIATTSAGRIGRTGLRSTVLAVAVLTAVAAVSLLVARPVLASIGPDPAALASTAATPAGAPSLSTWLRELVPVNVVKAAADGAMLPLIVFAVLFAVALTRIAPDRRAGVLVMVQGVADAMQQIVSWILRLAPLGVFALAVPLAARLGLAAAGAVLTYVGLVIGLTLVVIAALYPTVALAGGMSWRGFAAWCAPLQALAFASRSSLATLPAMIEAAERASFPPAASRVVLPLAVSVFHVGTAVAHTVGVLFLARLGGIALSAADLMTIAAVVVVASSAVPGIPGGSIVAIVPVLSAAHVPLEGIGLLLAVDAIPDMFRTTANVTGAMALTAMTAGPGGGAAGGTPSRPTGAATLGA